MGLHLTPGRQWGVGLPRRGAQKVKDSAKYDIQVEWSDDDQCYVGTVPGLIYGGCHGPDEREVFDELCVIVEEATLLYRLEGKPLPLPTSGRGLEC